MTRKTILALALSALALTGCEGIEQVQLPPPPPPATHTVSFVGYVFDGATGSRLDGYSLELMTNAETIPATLADERYSVGEISAWEDFTVTIDASGYRAFRAHNAHLGLPDEFDASSDISELSTQQLFHFDAYLFPSDLPSPEVTLTIDTGILNMPPSGTIRLRPTAASVIANSTTETPVGVPGQQWVNDEDLQLGAITSSFDNGTFTLAAGELVYGVAYQVNIYDVDGYQPFEGSYTAGIEADKIFTLAEEITAPLVMLTSNINSCTTAALPSDTMAAMVTIEFNQDIEFGISVYPGGELEALDDGLFISSPNLDADAFQNQLGLVDASTTQENGTVMFIDQSTLTFYWNASAGLVETDADDPITQVQWSNLNSIILQKLGKPSSQQALSSLIGTSFATCL